MSFPDAQWIWYVGLAVVLGAGLIVAVRNALGLWRETRGDYEPRHDPPLGTQYARREDHDKLAQAVVDLSKHTDARFSAFSRAQSASREKTYERLNQLAEQSAETRTLLDTVHQRQIIFDQKFDRLLERLAKINP